MAGVYREKGEVTSVRQSNDGKFAEITVAHGKRKPAPKATKTNPHPYAYDDRRTTNWSVPIEQADGYDVGRQVVVTIRCVKNKKAAKQSADDAVNEMYGGKAL